jgi:hypothetical protein
LSSTRLAPATWAANSGSIANLRSLCTYSKLLYVMIGNVAHPGPGRGGGADARARAANRRTRVTFRIPDDLAHGLRELGNQTAFVERVLRDALGHLCPLCHGSGHAPGARLEVSDLKALRLGRLDRPSAAQLKTLVRLGRALLATELELAAEQQGALGFRLARHQEELLRGSIPRGTNELKLTH